MHISVLTLELNLPGCASLKEKRGRLKPLLAGVHRRYNVSAAEVDLQDSHTRSVVACALVSNDPGQSDRGLAGIPGWLEQRFPDVAIVDHRIQPL